MTILLLACGVLAVAMPGLRPRGMLAGSPRWFVRLAVVSVGLGAAAITGALVVSAFVGAVHLLFGVAAAPVDHLAPEGELGSVVAAAALVWIVARSVVLVHRAARGRRAGRVDHWLGDHEPIDELDVVVIPTDAAVAYNVPGRRPQIVISEGLRARLPSEVLTFVLDHERAHLRARDRWVTLLATALETAFVFVPGAGRTAMALRIALERAADEAAAGGQLARRQRIAGEMTGAVDRGQLACGADLLQFRKRSLLAPSSSAVPNLSLAALGVLTVGAAAGSVAVHATADFGLYLALL